VQVGASGAPCDQDPSSSPTPIPRRLIIFPAFLILPR
jgi:hypothetical protein